MDPATSRRVTATPYRGDSHSAQGNSDFAKSNWINVIPRAVAESIFGKAQ